MKLFMAILAVIGLFVWLAGILIVNSNLKTTFAIGAPLQLVGLILFIVSLFWWLLRYGRT